jgi:predicted GNAT family N-acyltransferase
MKKTIKNPRDCTKAEIDTFERLVSEGGEVALVGLRNRIFRAENLIFIDDDGCVAVGAIKNPNSGYKSGVFQKARVSGLDQFKYELGWLYVTETGRGKGYGRELMVSVMEALSDDTCFATTRENNKAIHHLFSEFGFSRLGQPYKSDAGDYSLVLYAKS